MKEGYKDSALGEIPVKWEVVKLGDLFKLRSGEGISKSNQQIGNFPVYGGNGIAFYHNEYTHDMPQLIIGRVGAKCGCIHRTKEKSWITDNALIIHEDLIDYDTYFIEYVLNKLNLNDYANKNAQPVISGSKIYPITITLPPLPEQQKIASILSTADQKIEVIDQQIAETQELKKGLMQKLLTKGIGHTMFKDSALGEIPESWEVVKLVDIGEFFKGKGISKADLKSEGEHPCVRYGEIYTIYHTEIKKFESYIDEDVAKSSYKFNTGDLLFTGSGETIEDIGKCVTYLGDMEAYASGDIVIHRPNKGNSQYLSYFMNSELIRSQTRKLGQGNSVVHIYAKHLGQLVLSLPPIEEQQKIASILSTVDDKLEVLQDKKAEYQELKKGLMQQLLTGKTRVKLN